MSADATPPTPAPTDPLSAFISDLEAMWAGVTDHQTAGAYAAVVLSILLTIYTWYKYGATAGAPLAASFFICAAMIMK